MRIYEIITELLTALVLLSTNLKRQNIDSKIAKGATCKVIKMVFLDVNYLILIKYNYQTAKARALYESTDGPAGQPADYSPNSDRLGDFHRTVTELTVRDYWQPGMCIWWRFGSDPDPDPTQRSGTVANTILNSLTGSPSFSFHSSFQFKRPPIGFLPPFDSPPFLTDCFACSFPDPSSVLMYVPPTFPAGALCVSIHFFSYPFLLFCPFSFHFFLSEHSNLFPS